MCQGMECVVLEHWQDQEGVHVGRMIRKMRDWLYTKGLSNK